MVLKGVNLYEKGYFKVSDIKIENHKIVKIRQNLQDSKTKDGKNLYIFPPIVDLNVKLLDDKVNVTNIKNLCKQAKNGGVGTVALNPDLDPFIDNEIILEFIKLQNIDLEILPLIKATKDENKLTDIAILLKKGANSIYFHSDLDSFLISRIFEYAKMYDITLHCKAQNSSIRSVGVMHEGEVSSKLGLGGISELEEISEVSKIVEFAKYYGVKVLFKSLSSARSIEIIKKAKEEGIEVYSEVSLHHLIKNDNECLGYNTMAKIDPPLRDEKNRKVLVDFLKNGDIDLLTSLHSPKSKVLKDVSFDEAAFGIDSIESYFNELYKNFVKTEIISFEKLLDLIYEKPIKIAKIEPKNIEENFVIFDKENEMYVSL